MNKFLVPLPLVAVTVSAILGSPAQAQAQWPRYPTAGLPKPADGKPNLSAPAPRAGGNPDFTGIWLTDNFNCQQRSPDPESLTCGAELPMGKEGINMGASLSGGLPYQPWLAALVK